MLWFDTKQRMKFLMLVYVGLWIVYPSADRIYVIWSSSEFHTVMSVKQKTTSLMYLCFCFSFSPFSVQYLHSWRIYETFTWLSFASFDWNPYACTNKLGVCAILKASYVFLVGGSCLFLKYSDLFGNHLYNLVILNLSLCQHLKSEVCMWFSQTDTWILMERGKFISCLTTLHCFIWYIPIF